MPVRFSDMGNLTSPKAVVRLLEMLFACAAFSLAAVGDWSGATRSGPFATFATFTWCFSFAATLLIFLVEFTQFHSLLALSWKNLPVTLAAFAAFMNLAASVTYPLLVGSEARPAQAAATTAAAAATTTTTPTPPEAQAQARSGLLFPVAATIASCLTFLAYSTELLITKVEGKGGYMATWPGLLKVLEVFVACVLFVTLATVASPEFTGFRWCAGALCACALMSLVVIVMMVGECRACCPVPLGRLLLAFSTLASLLHGAVLLAWVLHLRRQTDWLAECPRVDCRRNQLLMSTFLIALNLLAYVTDFIYSIKLNCSRS
ncbi:myeloid-associated differentiation marker homolog [Carcharodon carcharias]|uniref:myeloid-associated differentiation marker homolog n=1 Tax=Carcharodon carcharias TaxID=13397 RepID=UPI001B7F3F26|nr:myeloid-associated differentiation marker homolog [Carcharodon carcharias]